MESSDQEGNDTQVSFNTYTHTDKTVKKLTIINGKTLSIGIYHNNIPFYLLLLFTLENKAICHQRQGRRLLACKHGGEQSMLQKKNLLCKCVMRKLNPLKNLKNTHRMVSNTECKQKLCLISEQRILSDAMI